MIYQNNTLFIEPISDLSEFRNCIRSTAPFPENHETAIRELSDRIHVAGKYIPEKYSWHIVNMADLSFVAAGGDTAGMFPIGNKPVSHIGFEDFVDFSYPPEVMYDNGHTAFVHQYFSKVKAEEKHLVSAQLILKMKNPEGIHRTLICHFSDWVSAPDGTIQFVLLVYVEPESAVMEPAHGMILSDYRNGGKIKIVANTPSHNNPLKDKKLTPKERQLLDLLAKGLSSKMIAHELGISKNTVDNRRQMLLKKMGCFTTPELISIAIRMRWI